MTADIEALWGAIKQESARAAARVRLRSPVADADDIACQVGMKLARYETVKPALIRRVAFHVALDERRRHRNLAVQLSANTQRPERTPAPQHFASFEHGTARQQEIIRAVLRCGSMRKAAQELGISTQGVSLAIKTFRKRVGLSDA